MNKSMILAIIVFAMMTVASPAFAGNGNNGNQDPRGNVENPTDPCEGQNNCDNGDHGRGRPKCNDNPNSWRGEPDACEPVEDTPDPEEQQDPDPECTVNCEDTPETGDPGCVVDCNNMTTTTITTTTTTTGGGGEVPEKVVESYGRCFASGHGRVWHEWDAETLRFQIYAEEFVDGIGQGAFKVASSMTALNPSLSPSLCGVIFEGNQNGQFDLYFVDLSGGNLRQLTNDAARELDVVWANDGSWNISYSVDNQVHMMNQWGRPIENQHLPEGTDAVTIGNMMAYANEGQIEVINTVTGEVSPIEFPAGTPLMFANDGRSLFYMIDGRICEFDIETLEETDLQPGVAATVNLRNDLLVYENQFRVYEETGLMTDRPITIGQNEVNLEIFGQEVSFMVNPIQGSPDEKATFAQQNISSETMNLWFTLDR